MIPDDMEAAATAVSYTDVFIDAGAAKLDALFGAGYARDHPQALAAYTAACASNLSALMTAAATMADAGFDDEFDDVFDEALIALAQDFSPKPAPKPKGRRR